MDNAGVRECGRRLPAEWEPQDGVLLTWPHTDTDWQPFLEAVTAVFVEIGRCVLQRQDLVVVVPDEAVDRTVRRALGGSGRGILRTVAYRGNDAWARDHGPVTVFADGVPLVLDFRFNGWGGKFPAERDDRIVAELAGAGVFAPSVRRERREFVLEGGAIDSDGKGSLLVTEECLLNPNRNPGLGRREIESVLTESLGVDRILWVGGGHLEGDDTDSHIDTLARFAPGNRILYTGCDDPRDIHAAPLADMERRLRELTDPAGMPYELIPLPWPSPQHDDGGRRLPATYANFLVINGAVLVPVYRDPADEEALVRISSVFPGREVIGIDCRPLIRQGGSLHCVTMQLPVGVLKPLDGSLP